MVCPYCAADIQNDSEGQYRCNSCNKIYRISLAGTVIKGARSLFWQIISWSGLGIFAAAILIHFAFSHTKFITVTKCFGLGSFGMFVAFSGSFIHAILAGEILLTKRPCYKEEGVAGWYVCLVFTGIAAVAFLLVAIQCYAGELFD